MNDLSTMPLSMFVTTNVLSRQAYFCRDKHVSVATKMILVATLASDTPTTAITDYAIRVGKLSATEQFFVGTVMAVRL